MKQMLLGGSAILLAAIVAGMSAHAAAPQDDAELLALGQKVFSQKCVNCHFVPDVSIPRDKAWLGLIKTTA